MSINENNLPSVTKVPTIRSLTLALLSFTLIML